MPKNKKSYLNPLSVSDYSNNIDEYFNFVRTMQDEVMYDQMTNVNRPNSFPAVILSGYRTNNNTGTGHELTDAKIVTDIDGLRYLDITVMPLTPFGRYNDPRAYKTIPEISEAILTYATNTKLGRARSQSPIEKSQISVPFGHVVQCYWEDGSTSDSNFSRLRFVRPTVLIPENSFLNLYGANPAPLGSDYFSNGGAISLLGAGLLGDAGGLVSTNQRGKRTKPIEYVVIHYSAAFGSPKAVLRQENREGVTGYHYIIARDGKYITPAPEDVKVNHMKQNGTVFNQNSVGVCFCNVGFERSGVPAKSDWITSPHPNDGIYISKGQWGGSGWSANKKYKWEPYTESSLAAGVQIVADILKTHSLTVDRIVGHSDVQSNKGDPGPAFNMARFRNSVKNKLGA